MCSVVLWGSNANVRVIVSLYIVCALLLFSVVDSVALLFEDKRTAHYELRRPHQSFSWVSAPAARERRRLLRGAPWSYTAIDTEAFQTLVHKEDAARWTSSSAWALSRPSLWRPPTQPELANSVGEAKGWVCAPAEEKSRFLRDLKACQIEYHSGPLPPSLPRCRSGCSSYLSSCRP